MAPVDQKITAHYWRMHVEEPGPNRTPQEKRERGWPFLTWPFFLAQLLMLKEVLALNVSSPPEVDQENVDRSAAKEGEEGIDGTPVLEGFHNSEADDTPSIGVGSPGLAAMMSVGEPQPANSISPKPFIPAEISALPVGGGGGGGGGGGRGNGLGNSRGSNSPGGHASSPDLDSSLAPSEPDQDGGGDIGKPNDSGGLEPGHSPTTPPIGSGGLPPLGPGVLPVPDSGVSVQLPPILGLPGVGLETDVSIQLPPALGLPKVGLETDVSVEISSAGLSGLSFDSSVSVGLPGGAETGLALDTNIEFAGDSILSSVSLEAAAFELNAQLDVRAGAGSLPLLNSIADASGDLTSLDPLPVLGGMSLTLLNNDPSNLPQELPLLAGLENSFSPDELLGPGFADDLDQQLASSALRGIGLQETMIMPLVGIVELAATPSTTSDASIIANAADLTALQGDGVMSSGEIFDFKPASLNGSSQLNELFSGSTYTDYNVALQELAPSEVSPEPMTAEADAELQHLTLQQIADDPVELPTLSNPVEPLFSVSPEELSIRATSI